MEDVLRWFHHKATVRNTFIERVSHDTFQFLLCSGYLYFNQTITYFFWNSLTYSWSVSELDANILDKEMADESLINSSKQVCASSGSVEEVPTDLSRPVHNTNQQGMLISDCEQVIKDVPSFECYLLFTDSTQGISSALPYLIVIRVSRMSSIHWCLINWKCIFVRVHCGLEPIWWNRVVY